MPTPWVVKLGGSLYYSGSLPLWLETLAQANAVIVPGGGPFADQVRAAQAHWDFSDECAHAMAILGMAQYGLMLAGLCSRVRAESNIERLSATVAAGSSVVWLPDPRRLPPAIPASWSVTSDSLAAWLAGRLHAAGLLLVKSMAMTGTRIAADRLAADGVVDSAFPGFMRGLDDVRIAGAADHSRLAEGLFAPEHLFTKIVSGH